ncbi:DUF262 domain-containing protein [Ignavibacterium album]
MRTVETQKYSVQQPLIETVLAWIKNNDIAIPEIQRPFVWDASKVRDLIDSLYNGYPIGYLITWKNPDVRLKDGKVAEGKKVLIDGQQRVTALTAAIVGEQVINKDYKRVRIKISFNPLEDKFEVFNTAIAKDNNWIADISILFRPEYSFLNIVNEYCEKNSIQNPDIIFEKLDKLKKITQRQIGLIELSGDLDIEIVTEIFIRINSQGVVLSQADFAMSKIASDERNNGHILRKCIDYFCHLAVAPDFYDFIRDNDREFAKTDYFQKMSWLKNENDDLYDPDYSDLLRVSFTSEFNRGKLADLVSLLSGRNFEKKTFEDEIAKQSFEKLEKGILNFINETNFKRFLMIIRSAGFISSALIRSQNTLNFAYILFLKLRDLKYSPDEIEHYVRRWFVLSVLTGRYSGSPESMFDFDIRNISSKGISDVLKDVESAELSDAFWSFGLVQNLETSVASSPYFLAFVASQIKSRDKGFLSKDITVSDLIEYKGDVHHIFPKEYLKQKGLKKSDYNQIANYVYMQSEINIQIGKRAPGDYLNSVFEQCMNGAKVKLGAINNLDDLKQNLKENCIPEETRYMTADDYPEFLKIRRQLIAQKLKEYYFKL